MRRTPWLLLAALLTPTPAIAQDAAHEWSIQIGESLTLRPHLEYRPRVLAHGGRDAAPGGSSAVVTQRIRLGLGATLFDDVHLRVDLQDIRTWGEELGTIGDPGSEGPEVYQAFGELRLLPGNALRVGRQEVKLDRGRIVWHRNWNDRAQALDGILASQSLAGFDAKGMWFRISEDDVFETDADGNVVRGAAGDHDLFGLHVRSQHLDWFRPSVMFFYDNNSANENVCILYGAWVDGKPFEGFEYRVEAYHQLGRRPSGDSGVPVSAFLAAARAEYTWQALLGLSVAAGVDVLSGDNPDTSRAEGFEQMYGARHIYLGEMDMFKNFGKDSGNAGIVDSQLAVALKPAKSLKVSTTYHHFSAARGDLGANRFGEEVDLRADYRLGDYLDLRAGAGVFVPGAAFRCARRDCGSEDSAEWLTYFMAKAYY